MNKNERKSVMLIYGGRGFERDVSLLGAKNLLPMLKKHYDVIPVMIDSGGGWFTENDQVFATNFEGHGGLYRIKKQSFSKIDVAFPLLHGDFGEDGIVQGVLDSVGIPYVGCHHNEGAICRSKSTVKCIAEHLGIPTLPFVTVNNGDDGAIEEIEKNLQYPVIVKPDCLGSSIGLEKAEDRKELASAIKSSFAFSKKLIVEKMLSPRRELECGYFATKEKTVFTHPSEIIYGDGVYDYEKKYIRDTRVSVVADISCEISLKIQKYSKKLIDFLGVRQISRVDFFLCGQDLYFNEINTMPGFTESSLYRKMLEHAGINTDDAIISLIEECLLLK